MFPGARLKNTIEQFKIDQTGDVVFMREAGNKFGFVFRYPTSEIVCDANIQRPIPLACQNVNEERRVQGTPLSFRRVSRTRRSVQRCPAEPGPVHIGGDGLRISSAPPRLLGAVHRIRGTTPRCFGNSRPEHERVITPPPAPRRRRRRAPVRRPESAQQSDRSSGGSKFRSWR
jgi:hypothetical protein